MFLAALNSCSKSSLDEKLPNEIKKLSNSISDRQINNYQLSEQTSVVSISSKKGEQGIFVVMKWGKPVLVLTTTGNSIQSNTLANKEPAVIVTLIHDPLQNPDSMDSVAVLRQCLDKDGKPIAIQYDSNGEIEDRLSPHK